MHNALFLFALILSGVAMSTGRNV